ncbi:hypothetical protein ACFZAR_43680 [Streptomyces sp. NPDC008222]|uniref:hypothetical protein n=1 Tax=Streptomyces sp. NPDC008222 TaxID=3364820 RepID=UPI0036ED653E
MRCKIAPVCADGKSNAAAAGWLGCSGHLELSIVPLFVEKVVDVVDLPSPA